MSGGRKPETKDELGQELLCALQVSDIDNLVAHLAKKRAGEVQTRTAPQIVRSVEDLLAAGADPLFPVTLNPNKPPISPLEVAFNNAFNQPCDCNVEAINYFAEDAITLLFATKGRLPRKLFEMAKEKQDWIMYYNDMPSIPQADKVLYENDSIFSNLPEVRTALVYHEVRELVAEKGKLAFPKDQPTLTDSEYHWEKKTPETMHAKQVLELLRKTWFSKKTLHKVLTDNELWKSPEDRAAFAAIIAKEYGLRFQKELTLPQEIFRPLNEHDAESHLARYLKKSADRGPRSPGAS